MTVEAVAERSGFTLPRESRLAVPVPRQSQGGGGQGGQWGGREADDWQENLQRHDAFTQCEEEARQTQVTTQIRGASPAPRTTPDGPRVGALGQPDVSSTPCLFRESAFGEEAVRNAGRRVSNYQRFAGLQNIPAMQPYWGGGGRTADFVQEVFAGVPTGVAEFRPKRPGESFRDWLWGIYCYRSCWSSAIWFEPHAWEAFRQVPVG